MATKAEKEAAAAIMAQPDTEAESEAQPAVQNPGAEEPNAPAEAQAAAKPEHMEYPMASPNTGGGTIESAAEDPDETAVFAAQKAENAAFVDNLAATGQMPSFPESALPQGEVFPDGARRLGVRRKAWLDFQKSGENAAVAAGTMAPARALELERLRLEDLATQDAEDMEASESDSQAILDGEMMPAQAEANANDRANARLASFPVVQVAVLYAAPDPKQPDSGKWGVYRISIDPALVEEIASGLRDESAARILIKGMEVPNP